MTRPVRFALGQMAITANASLRLSTEEVRTALRRHAGGDWGDLCPEDALANDTALSDGVLLESLERRFRGHDGVKIATVEKILLAGGTAHVLGARSETFAIDR